MASAPKTENTSKPTRVGSGNADTTPPEAEQTGNTHSPAEEGEDTTLGDTKMLSQSEFEKVLKKRLERERRQWESEAEEREKRAKMEESERLRLELTEKDKALQERDALLKRERAMRALASSVVDADDAYLIAERLGLVDEDGNVDKDALLEAKPYLAVAPTPGQGTKAPTTGAGGGSLPKDPSKLSDEEYFALKTKQ